MIPLKGKGAFIGPPFPPLCFAHTPTTAVRGGGLLFASSAADHTLTHSLPRESLALKRALDCSFREKEREKEGVAMTTRDANSKGHLIKRGARLVFLEDVTG